MKKEILGTLGKLGSEAITSAANLRHEIEVMSFDRMERLAKKLNLVTREEFESLKAMLKETRSIQEELLHRVSHLDSNPKPATRVVKKSSRKKKKN